MRAVVVALLMLTTSLARADAPAPHRILARTAFGWVLDVVHVPSVAVRKTSGALRHDVTIASSCMAKHDRTGVAIGDKRGPYLACLGESLAGRKIDPTWTVVELAKLPRPAHRAWAKSFPKTSKFVVGNHEDGYIVVAFPAHKERTGWKVSGVFVDESFGRR